MSARKEAVVSDVATLLRRQADDARALAGARSSAWNGEVGWLPRPGRAEPHGVVGIADWDGTIYYDRNYVLRPLEAFFEKAPRTAPDAWELAELWRTKNALAVVLHENCHLLAETPSEHLATKDAWSWPLVVLEEGATELFSQGKLDDYVHRLGLDRSAPGLRGLRVEATYPLFVPAVATLTQGVGRLTRQSGAEVLRQVVSQAGGRKFQTLGNLVVDGTGLGARIPSAERAAVVEQLAQTTRDVFGEVAQMGPYLSRESSVRLSRRLGREALRAILVELEGLDVRYPRTGPPDSMAIAHRAPLPTIGRARSHRQPALDAGSGRANAGLTR